MADADGSTTAIAAAATPEQTRAQQLAEQASGLIRDGAFEPAARALREASAIAPDDLVVKAAWLSLQEEQSRSPLTALCKKWLTSRAAEDGVAVLAWLKHNRTEQKQPLTHDEADEAMAILFDFTGDDDTLDRATALLLYDPAARPALAARLVSEPTLTYERLFERGDASLDGLVAITLDRGTWTNDEQRVKVQRDVFMLSLAQMMEFGLDHPERAMRAIARLLSTDTANLKGIIDSDSFDVILEALDILQPPGLRSQATLATAKLLELSPETAQSLITQFVTSKVSKPTVDGLTTAFSAAAAIFPIVPSAAATLFLTDGFIPQMVPLVQTRKSARLEQAALELLSAACIDKTCRESIGKHCRDWLDGISWGFDKKRANLAALILVKLGEQPAAAEQQQDQQQQVGPVVVSVTPSGSSSSQDDIISRFKHVVLEADDTSLQESVEGLAYASLQSKVKETLANDHRFLVRLIEMMSVPEAQKPVLFGGLTIFVNLTVYAPPRSEEEKKIAELKAYAQTSKPTPDDPLDSDDAVTSRCKKVLDSRIVPLLVTCSKRASPSVMSQVLHILLSLSKEQKHRGLMAQQGAIKLLLQIWDQIHKEAHPRPASYTADSNHACAHALARLLISVNPAHVFNTTSTLDSTNAIRPLLSLIPSPGGGGGGGDDDDDGSEPTLSPNGANGRKTRSLLPTFEALLALTNLASHTAANRTLLIRLLFPSPLDDMLLHNNAHVQRAATELTCNLMLSPEILPFFANSPTASVDQQRARTRLQVLLALADSPETSTRLAAGGALAMLTSYPLGCAAILAQPRGVPNLLSLCAGNADEIARGIACLRNLVFADDDDSNNHTTDDDDLSLSEIQNQARDRFRTEGGQDAMKQLVTRIASGDIRVSAETIEALRDVASALNS